jgi:hypothetical protein
MIVELEGVTIRDSPEVGLPHVALCAPLGDYQARLFANLEGG